MCSLSLLSKNMYALKTCLENHIVHVDIIELFNFGEIKHET